MNRLAVYLNRHIDGVVYSAPSILTANSTDRSVLKYFPRLVAEPEGALDVRRLARFSYQLAQKKIPLPITLRGSGLNKNATDIGTGLIVSLNRMNYIQEIDTTQRLIRVQTGVTLGELRKSLLLHGLDFVVLGDERETIGDLIARNASAYDNTAPTTISSLITCAEVVLSDGSLIQIEPLKNSIVKKKTKLDNFEGDIYHELLELQKDNADQIAKRDSLHSRAGFAGIKDFKDKKLTNLIPLFCGADNSLGIMTEVILRVEPVFDEPKRVAVVCRNANDYVKVVTLMQKLNLTDLFVYDTELYNEIQNTGKTSKFFRKASDDGYLVTATIKDDSSGWRRRKLRRLKRELSPACRLIIEEKDNQNDFAVLNNNLRAYLNDSSKNMFRLPLIDGVYVPRDSQVRYLNAVTRMSDKLGVALAIYGRPEFDSFTVRPNYTINTADGRRKMVAFMREYIKMVYDLGGNACGDSSEGRFLPIFINQYRNSEELKLDGYIKQIFDPFDIMNPGIKQEADTRNILRHFRIDYSDEIISEH